MSKEATYRLKITSKRQVTFPKDVMDALMLEPGDILEIRETQAGYALAIPDSSSEDNFPLQKFIQESTSPLEIDTFRENGYDPSLRD